MYRRRLHNGVVLRLWLVRLLRLLGRLVRLLGLRRRLLRSSHLPGEGVNVGELRHGRRRLLRLHHLC
jgi:hypothetical protein